MANEQPNARRQRRIARRRQEILDAAAQVFARKSYSQATTKEIAHEADVSEGTLYNYFGRKRDILLAIANETKLPLEQALLEAGGLQDRETMVTLFEKALAISEAQLPFARTLISEAWVDDGILQEFLVARLGRIYLRLQEYIAERIAAGAFRPFDPGLGARLIVGMFGAIMLPSLRGAVPPPPPGERRALSEAMVDLILDGIRSRGTV